MASKARSFFVPNHSIRLNIISFNSITNAFDQRHQRMGQTISSLFSSGYRFTTVIISALPRCSIAIVPQVGKAPSKCLRFVGSFSATPHSAVDASASAAQGAGHKRMAHEFKFVPVLLLEAACNWLHSPNSNWHCAISKEAGDLFWLYWQAQQPASAAFVESVSSASLQVEKFCGAVAASRWNEASVGLNRRY